jgi:hypothetical protein
MRNDYLWSLDREYLFHHGIKGQKWGVRNGPPYPIEDRTMKAGTRLNSVEMVDTKLVKYKKKNLFRKKDIREYANDYESYDRRNKGRWLYTYNSDDEWDKKVYTGPFAEFKINNDSSDTLTMPVNSAYELTKDITLANSSERYKAFKSLYSKNADVAEDLKHLQQVNKKKIARGRATDSDMALDKINLDKSKHTEIEMQQMYIAFNRLMEHSQNFASTRAYTKMMQEKYDGMVDDNNVNIYNEAHDPVIIFDRNALRRVSSEELTPDTIASNAKAVKDALTKKGKTMLL